MPPGKTSVSQRVVDYISRHIADGAWKINDAIPSENVLSKQLGVSRVSVRLAIRQLAGLGILESVHGKGTYLRSDDSAVLGRGNGGASAGECRDLGNILQYRLVIEPGLCRIAVPKTGAKDLFLLQGHLGALVAAIGDPGEFVRHDIAFHEEIARIGGNPLLEKGLREVFDRTMADHQRINALFGYKDGVYYHSLIFNAFEKREAGLAGRLMTEHLENALERLAGSP